MTAIRDPQTQSGARIDETGRLQTISTTETVNDFYTHLGEAYNINTGNITLTNATKTPVLYIKNLGNYELIITAFFYILGVTTGGSGNRYVEVVRNPTGGTIISGATPVDIISNRNFASSNTADINAYKGATGLTMTGGEDAIASILTGDGRTVISVGTIVIAKGNSVGINYTPPVGNTSQVVQFATACYYETIQPPYRT